MKRFESWWHLNQFRLWPGTICERCLRTRSVSSTDSTQYTAVLHPTRPVYERTGERRILIVFQCGHEFVRSELDMWEVVDFV